MTLDFKNNSHLSGYHVHQSPIDVDHLPNERHALEQPALPLCITSTAMLQVLSGQILSSRVVVNRAGLRVVVVR